MQAGLTFVSFLLFYVTESGMNSQLQYYSKKHRNLCTMCRDHRGQTSTEVGTSSEYLTKTTATLALTDDIHTVVVKKNGRIYTK